ncbi:S-adenosyl-L-methionine-dependent methyltransferase [Xylaria bambusicola]|uniref:S-adenosyl-L-methionine-dependent methyltransferase n=1 Tax=Xylaria bambusicola TaxID=326684 RepID=UPI002008D1F9|nr:S-adenosyl-L-methionine-dependent methyltransferase [Xylaria bambusicola]KAI0526402.1 S-adenosyl-L-methionine-dependent methyltransferase [Xylaria bambusicola]
MSDSRKSNTSEFALQPISSTLAVYSQTELQASSRREGTRPPTSSTSSQSGIIPEWNPNRQSYYSSRAVTSLDIDDLNLEPNEFWPPSDSDDSGCDTTLKRTTPSTSGSTARKIKAILQRFGRSYNKRYDLLPNDAQEKDRNTLQHNICLETFDGKLHQAPVNNARRVLDLGCGPGDWALEFARRNPNAIVLGIDIDPVKSSFSLPNCRFEVTDFNKEWSYDVKFDFIHLRHYGRLPKKDVVTSIYETLSPGGWAEFTEWIISVQFTQGSSTSISVHKWMSCWNSGLLELGRSVHFPLQYRSLLTEVGFKNVTERKYAVPMNPWPPGKSLQRLGSMMNLNVSKILEPMSMPIFTEALGWTPEAVKSLLAEVLKELADADHVHAYLTLFTVYAQKSRGEFSSSSSIRSSEHG